MLKEKFESAKQFVKEHKTEIVLGTISIGAIAILGVKCNNDSKLVQSLSKELKETNDKLVYRGITITNLEIGMEKMYQMFSGLLNREETRIVFEMKALQEYINNLDSSIKINQFVNIPNAKERINELAIQLKELLNDAEKAQEIMEYILN